MRLHTLKRMEEKEYIFTGCLTIFGILEINIVQGLPTGEYDFVIFVAHIVYLGLMAGLVQDQEWNFNGLAPEIVPLKSYP